MSITLGSNVASLRGIRQIDNSNQKLSKIFERLSSGQRITRASDDAAGLAIASSLDADVVFQDTQYGGIELFLNVGTGNLYI